MANKLRLVGPPQALNDGTGMVEHDIFAVTDTGEIIPGRHQTVLIAESDIVIWATMPDSTGPQRQAKNDAYKALLAAGLPASWLDSALQETVNSNVAAGLASGSVADYIQNTLGQGYPLDFSL